MDGEELNNTNPVDNNPGETPKELNIKEKWMANIKNSYPDKNFESEDDYYSTSMEDYNNMSDRIKKYEEDNKFVLDKLQENPSIFNFVNSILSGKSVPASMALLKDIVDLEEGTPEYEEYQKAVQVLKDEENAYQEKAKQRQQNMEASSKILEAFAEKNGLTPEQLESFIKDIETTITEKIFSGNFDEDFFERFYRLFNYDKDMEDAMEQGRIQGRNEQIETRRNRSTNTDGLPNISSKGTPGEEQKPTNPRQSMADAIARYNKNNGMF